MLFNSINFAIFLPIVFMLYWFVARKSLRLQNILMLAASYFFYASWDYRFLFLLIFSTVLDFYTGLKIHKSTAGSAKRFWLWLSIIINAGFLGVFKYYNFFISSFAEAVGSLGFQINPWTLQVVLPVGISFYTFHGLSYVLDIYNGRAKAERDFIDYSLFVSFFPLLVAGPIERATHLLPQIKVARTFDYVKAVDGCRQILWGLFKKIVIADNCATFSNLIFENTEQYSGTTLLLGAILFAIQIYGDFSGYSDIALGTARLFGFSLLRNFAFPYFSRDIAEFWRRWHISLSSWFRDYVYIPLGGSKGSTGIKVRNTFIIFGLSGFWHGANWTFIVWGLLNAAYFLPSLLMGTNRDNLQIVACGRTLPTLSESLLMLRTFMLVVLAWIFFRAQNLSHASAYLKRMVTGFFAGVSLMETYRMLARLGYTFLFLLLGFIILEWFGREEQYATANLFGSKSRPWRHAFYYVVIIVILAFGGREQQFIYFQF
jgi:alginate O-acetyltransferase complex protein AlgI